VVTKNEELEMRNYIDEVEFNGEDVWQANVNNEKFIFDDDKVFVQYGCNLDEIKIIEFSQHGSIDYKVYECITADQVIKEIAHDVITEPFNDFEYDEDDFYQEDTLYSMIDNSDIDELIYEINKSGNIYIRVLDLEDFVKSDIKSETIINILISNNLVK
jgi:hypothetical protein